jgi:flagellar protein FlbD
MRGMGIVVIELTRIDGTTFYLNPDLIEVVEAAHDTHITLVNGHKYVCAETPEAIAELIAEFRRSTMGAIRRAV